MNLLQRNDMRDYLIQRILGAVQLYFQSLSRIREILEKAEITGSLCPFLLETESLLLQEVIMAWDR